MVQPSRRFSNESIHVERGAASSLLTLGLLGRLGGGSSDTDGPDRSYQKVHTRNPSPWDTEAEDSYEFKISLGYISKSCLKESKPK